MSNKEVIIIKTESVGKSFAKTNPIVLDATSTTALVFDPQIHDGGVRGHLIRLKKNKDDKFEKPEEVDFRTLKLGEGVKIELGTQQLKRLLEGVSSRELIAKKEGISNGKSEYRLLKPNEETLVVSDKNKKDIIKQILDSGYSEDYWNLLSSSSPELADKLSFGHIQWKRKIVIDDLKQRLNSNHKPHETIGDDSWQNWIYKNYWLFGVNYFDVLQKTKINIKGIMPDYLFLTMDGFIDILEIKLPSMEVIEEDASHPGSWIWSKDANKAIGQVVNYLNEIARCQLEIENSINRSILKPRGYILIGNSENWSKEKKQGLRKLNHALHGIEILTYHNLVQRGYLFINDKLNLATI